MWFEQLVETKPYSLTRILYSSFFSLCCTTSVIKMADYWQHTRTTNMEFSQIAGRWCFIALNELLFNIWSIAVNMKSDIFENVGPTQCVLLKIKPAELNNLPVELQTNQCYWKQACYGKDLYGARFSLALKVQKIWHFIFRTRKWTICVFIFWIYLYFLFLVNIL